MAHLYFSPFARLATKTRLGMLSPRVTHKQRDDDVFVGLCLRNGESSQVVSFTFPFRKITKGLHERDALCYAVNRLALCTRRHLAVGTCL